MVALRCNECATEATAILCDGGVLLTGGGRFAKRQVIRDEDMAGLSFSTYYQTDRDAFKHEYPVKRWL